MNLAQCHKISYLPLPLVSSALDWFAENWPLRAQLEPLKIHTFNYNFNEPFPELLLGEAGLESDWIPSRLKSISFEVTDSVGLIRLDKEPLFGLVPLEVGPGLIPNFSGFVIGVGGRVILGDPSLIDRDMELSLTRVVTNIKLKYRM